MLSHPSSTEASEKGSIRLSSFDRFRRMQIQALTLRLYVSLWWEGSANSGFLLFLPSHFDHSLQTLVLFPLRPPSSNVPCRMTEKGEQLLNRSCCQKLKIYSFFPPKNIREITMAHLKDKLHMPCVAPKDICHKISDINLLMLKNYAI